MIRHGKSRASGGGSPNEAERSTDRQVRDKIKTIDEMGVLAYQLHAAGRTITLVHGTFDLLHMGHVRHLESARREGDILMVTVTADAHVIRTPDRPVFADHMRAEMLAALEYVDFVGVHDGVSAIDVIRTIRPEAYVKGADYANPEDDVTGKIVDERNAVEEHGGRLVITKDITFSSSSLLNKHFDLYDPELRDYLDDMRESGAVNEILELIERVKDFRVLLVGDAIVDEYQYVMPLGKSPKEMMIATQFENREVFAGGVFAAANHIASFCKEIEVITSLGNLDSHEELIRKNLKPNVRLTPLHRDGVPTTRKSRFIESGYMRKVFEVYFMDDSPLDAPMETALNTLIKERAGDFDVVIATDFGHGLIGPSTTRTLVDTARFLAVNTQTNSANAGFNLVTKYPKADYVCIDAPEARLATRERTKDIDTVISELLPGVIECSRLTVTHGTNGCVTFETGQGVTKIPAFTKTVVDTVGAGDAFLAVTAPIVAAGGSMDLVGFIGNAAGAIKVSILGHRQSVEKPRLVKFLTTLLK